jgi:hypothetical protein
MENAEVIQPECVLSLSDLFAYPHAISRDVYGNVYACGDGGDTIAVVDPAGTGDRRVRVITEAGKCGILSSVDAVGESLVAVTHVCGEWFRLPLQGDLHWKPMPMAWVREPFLAARRSSEPILVGKDGQGEWIIETGTAFAKIEIPNSEKDVVAIVALDDNHFAVQAEADTPYTELILLVSDGRCATPETRVSLD